MHTMPARLSERAARISRVSLLFPIADTLLAAAHADESVAEAERKAVSTTARP